MPFFIRGFLFMVYICFYINSYELRSSEFPCIPSTPSPEYFAMSGILCIVRII
jgi:hypothetical protein